MNSLLVTVLAKQDLRDIKQYIACELASPVAAVKIVSRIVNKIEGLTEHPCIGAPLSSVADVETDYRFLVCGNYLVFYRYSNEIVRVMRVLYGKRDYLRVLFGHIEDRE